MAAELVFDPATSRGRLPCCCSLRWLAVAAGWVAALAVAIAPSNASLATEESGWRYYSDGPLLASEFRGTRPSSVSDGMLAHTETVCRYRYHYRFDRTRRGIQARVTSIEFVAVFVPEESWNAAPDDRLLLEHEQGHFDITYAAALEAQLEFEGRIRRGRGMTAIGSTREEAARRLDEQLKHTTERFLSSLGDQHQHYDEITGHGTNRAAQREFARVHQQRIQLLQEQLDQLRANADAG
jgi:hypothetical protein